MKLYFYSLMLFYMMFFNRIIILIVFIFNSVVVFSQNTITFFAGDGTYGTTNGAALASSFKSPRGMTMDELGNLYVVDMDAHMIRKITPDGIVSTFAGTGVAGDVVGAPDVAQFNSPFEIVMDRSGYFLVTDVNNNKIKRISPTGYVSNFIGDGIAGDIDGNGVNARLNKPHSICIDYMNTIFITDTYNHKIKRCDSDGSNVITYSGSGVAGNINGSYNVATFQYPQGLAIDGFGNMFVGSGGYTIRKISYGNVSTFAGNYSVGDLDGQGTAAQFTSISQLRFGPNNNLYVTDYYVNKIKQVDRNANVTTLVRSSGYGSMEGDFTTSKFAFPSGLYYNNKEKALYFTEVDFRKVRKVNLKQNGCQLLVTNTNDTGIGSLRNCIECANLQPGKDVITFSPTIDNDTIKLSQGLPEIIDPLEINGNVDVDGWPTSNIKLNLSINNMSLSDDYDACIINSDSVTINNLMLDGFYKTLWIKKRKTSIVVNNNLFINYLFLRTDTIGTLIFKNNSLEVLKNGKPNINTYSNSTFYSGNSQYFQGDSILMENNQFGGSTQMLLYDNITFVNNLVGISRQNFATTSYFNSRFVGDNNIVKNNYFGNSYYGLELYVSYGKNNLIENNVIGEDKDGNPHPVKVGLFLFAGVNNKVINNKITNYTIAAFERLDDTSNVSYMKLVLSKNLLINLNQTIKYYRSYINLLNYNIYKPKITQFSSVGSQVTIYGKSKPNDTVEVFYVKDAFIESIDEYIGTTYSDQNGNWSFTFTKKPQYNFVRSTFTKYGFTSGFSDAFPVEESAMTCYVTNVNDSGPGSFREALECANTTPGPSKIKFAIPGPGPYIIKPVTTFPLIGNNTDPLEILGETQKSSGVGYGIQNITLSGELLTPTLSSWKFINTSISSILFDSILNNDIEAYASKFVSVEFKNIRGINVGSPYTNSRALNKGYFDSCTFRNMNRGVSYGTDGGSNPASIRIYNSYFLDVEKPISGAFYGDSVFVVNSKIGKDKNGNISACKSGISFGPTTNIWIENNEIYTTTESGSAIYISACRNVEIKKNKLEQVTSTYTSNPLIHLAAINSYSTYNNRLVISGNEIINAQNESLVINYSDSIEIVYNTISNGLRNGIVLNGVNYVKTIENNIISNHNLDGFSLIGPQSIKKIFNNKISKCYNGISMSGYIYPSNCVSNIITDCKEYGINLNGSVQNVIWDNNQIKNNILGGIKNSGSTSNIKFINNIIENNGDFGVLADGSSSNCVYSKNIINSNNIGIQLSNGSSNNFIDSNTFIANSNAIILYNGSSLNICKRNLFKGGVIQIKVYNGASGNLFSQNTYEGATKAIDLTLNDINFSPGNNSKDTASITAANIQSNSLMLSGTGIDGDSIEVFSNNKTQENAFAYVGKTKVIGGVWSLAIPSGLGYNPLASNHYIITSTDANNNTSQLSNYFSIPIKLNATNLNLLPKNGGICYGESYTLDAVVDSVTYKWFYNDKTSSPIAYTKQHPVSTGGTYIIDVQDSYGNTASDTISVIENTAPLKADFIMPSTTGIDDITVVVDISYTKPDSVRWNWGGAIAEKGIDNYILSFPSTGTYTVELTSILGACYKTVSNTITVVPGRTVLMDPTVYPYNIRNVNAGPIPVLDYIDLQIEMANKAPVSIAVYDLLGNNLIKQDIDAQSLSFNTVIDFTNFSSGIYYLRVISGPDVRLIKVMK